ncbi:RHS repeat-associated core domain-containing protein [Pectobacterium aroidearum]|nr:RHS repeat-associated core domain-containing protein [Pectobacterium aroidearum]MDY4385116.1 RHS repeat-associated core domain-containing protein [Pectobacterium aroidearum]
MVRLITYAWLQSQQGARGPGAVGAGGSAGGVPMDGDQLIGQQQYRADGSAAREERRPIPLRRYLGDAANEEVYCELRYQGQLYDAETGLYYNRHRYYDAESGQYLSPDPIGLGGGIRPQGYVANPLEFCDPLGLARFVCQARYERYKDYRSQGYSAEEAAKLSKGANPAMITPGSLPAAEEAAVNRTLGHIDNGDKPAGALGKKWGTTFKNHQGELPGGSGANSP